MGFLCCREGSWGVLAGDLVTHLYMLTLQEKGLC